ncbi:MAG TPA: hypothetical protein DDW16_01160, partial [Clostridiales bacterium]|nr:hypothetical protein [Clostridiales bacterium]
NVLQQKDDFLAYKDKKQVFLGGVLGFFIGLAIIVPGVSGAAIAIILGLYEKLLYSMGNLFKSFKKCIKFLIPVIIGGIIGFVGGFFTVQKLLNLFPFAVIALFGGFMFGSYPAITDKIKNQKRTALSTFLFALGVIIPVVISLISVFYGASQRGLTNLRIYHYIIFLVIGYLIAITQIIPGLSATALLMTLGYFTALLNAVGFELIKNVPLLMVYVCLVIGFVIGMLTFSKILSLVLAKFEVNTFNLIAGLSLGAVVTMFFNPDIYEVYSSWHKNGINVWELVIGIVLFVIGMILAYKLVLFERKHVKIETEVVKDILEDDKQEIEIE